MILDQFLLVLAILLMTPKVMHQSNVLHQSFNVKITGMALSFTSHITSSAKKWSFRTFVHCRLTFASLLAILERNQTFSFRIEQRKVWAWFLKSIAKMVMKLKRNALKSKRYGPICCGPKIAHYSYLSPTEPKFRFKNYRGCRTNLDCLG